MLTFTKKISTIKLNEIYSSRTKPCKKHKEIILLNLEFFPHILIKLIPLNIHEIFFYIIIENSSQQFAHKFPFSSSRTEILNF
jgi:hypothetical protein